MSVSKLRNSGGNAIRRLLYLELARNPANPQAKAKFYHTPLP